MMFRVGQRVVCVDADSGEGEWPSGSRPVLGQIYTVRSIEPTILNSAGLKLVELCLTSTPGHCGIISKKIYKDAAYRAARFRPIVERKTDISVFKAMLTSIKEPVQ
jgi:hypothetical protein